MRIITTVFESEDRSRARCSVEPRNFPTAAVAGALAQAIDVAHFHNTFPLISPSAYYAVRRAGVPVVQTLHNFRLICAGATLSRNGSVCENRASSSARCCPGSRMAAIAKAGPQLQQFRRCWRCIARWERTRRQVDVYIASGEFARRKFIDGGLPGDRIVVKPNFVSPDPGVGEGRGGYALFVGRLAKREGHRDAGSGMANAARYSLR